MSDTLTAPFAQANKAPVQIQSPFDVLNQAGDVAAKMNANRLFQAQTAQGQAAQQAVGPDGQFDLPTYNRLLAGNPAAAQAAPAALAQSTELAGQQQGQALKSLQAQSTALDSLGPNASYQDVLNKVHEGVKAGWLQPQGANSVLVGMPSGDDPQSMATRSHQLQVMGDQLRTASERLQSQYGTPTTVDNGQSVQGGTVNPRGGALTVPGATPAPSGQGVQKVTSPETQATLVDVVDPVTGAHYKVPRSALPNAGGQPASPLGTGRPPAGSPLLNPNAAPPATPQATPASAAPTGNAAPNPVTPPATAPQGGTMSSMPLGQPEAIAADVAKFKQDQFAIPQGQQNVQSLQKAQTALEASNTGRSSEGVHNMLATLQTLGVPLPSNLSDNVTNYDLAHKLLLDYARKSGAAAHSDLQLQSSEGANASTGISNQAALDVVHTNIGRERQSIALNQEAPQSGIGYGSHASNFSTSTDPRGFAVDAYKPADLNPNDPTSMVGKMTQDERAKFYKSAGIAQRLKLINPAPPAAAPVPRASAAPAAQPQGNPNGPGA